MMKSMYAIVFLSLFGFVGQVQTLGNYIQNAGDTIIPILAEYEGAPNFHYEVIMYNECLLEIVCQKGESTKKGTNVFYFFKAVLHHKDGKLTHYDSSLTKNNMCQQYDSALERDVQKKLCLLDEDRQRHHGCFYRRYLITDKAIYYIRNNSPKDARDLLFQDALTDLFRMNMSVEKVAGLTKALKDLEKRDSRKYSFFLENKTSYFARFFH